MKIEIWSDVMCPFCYIGKRNFESALEQFSDKEEIEVIWKSFQLNPYIPEIPNESYQDYLIKHKGMSAEQVKGMLDNVTQIAKRAGLEFNLEQAVIVNSMNAHKIIQFAKTKGLGDEAEERLFHAFFTEGKNIADLDTLTQLGKEIGLEKTEMDNAFRDEKYSSLVKQDIQEAQQLGVQGVPFFVLNRKYAISGAQPSEAFSENLKVAFAEWRKLNPKTKLEVTQGQSCTPDGNCD
ncbi:DsbA family oxidoreductase [Aequorivita ciconiae]|nr:DsbA family oxidoreductase [Aequorivita sp. H23M31]